MKLKSLLDLPIVKNAAAYIKANTDPEQFAINAYEVISIEPEFPIEKLLNANRETFQRRLQPSRLRKLIKKVYEYGYDMSRFVVITEKNMIVDGQHRVIVALLFGLKTVPVVVARFKGKQSRASYFITLNRPEGGQQLPTDRILGEYNAGQSYAKLVYRLVEDKNCTFFDRVALRSKHGAEPQNPSSKMHFVPFSKIINWIGLDYPRGTDTNNQPILEGRADGIEYQEALNRVNGFGNWYLAIHQNDVRKAGAFANKPLTGFLRFYRAMELTAGPDKRLLARMKKATIKRFQQYDLKNLSQVDVYSAPFVIAKYYNGTRQTLRVDESLIH
jgi:hypothetical protein